MLQKKFYFQQSLLIENRILQVASKEFPKRYVDDFIVNNFKLMRTKIFWQHNPRFFPETSTGQSFQAMRGS